MENIYAFYCPETFVLLMFIETEKNKEGYLNYGRL